MDTRSPGLLGGRPVCVDCGRALPKGRREKCYVCRPLRPHHKSRPPEAEFEAPEYTLADRVAQAEACGISYGQLMSIVEAGAELPLRRKVRWPEGSAHAGE